MSDVHAERLAAEISRLDERIRELEAEVERMRPVVEAAVGYRHGNIGEFTLQNAIADYEQSRPK